MKIAHGIILIGSVLSIAIADIFLKKASANIFLFKDILKSPWFFAAIILYGIQIAAFCYLFFSGNKLVTVGIIQIVLYALIIVSAGVFIFGESFPLIHGVGAILAIIGVVLLNI